MVWESFRSLLANSKQAAMCLFTEEWLLSGHSTIKAWLVECYRNGFPSGRFSHLPRGTLELCQNDHQVIGHLPDQGPSPPMAENALGRVVVVPNFFNIRMMEAAVFLGTFNACRHFLVTFPRSVPRRVNPVLEFYGQFLRPRGLFFSLTCPVNCGTLYIQAFLPKSCPINQMYHRWTPIKL